MAGIILLVVFVALLVAMAIWFERLARGKSFFAPRVGAEDIKAKLLAPGGLPKPTRTFTVLNSPNGDLLCSQHKNNITTDVTIGFAPDGDGVHVIVQPTHITRLNGINVSGGLVAQIKRRVRKTLRELPTAAA